MKRRFKEAPNEPPGASRHTSTLLDRIAEAHDMWKSMIETQTILFNHYLELDLLSFSLAALSASSHVLCQPHRNHDLHQNHKFQVKFTTILNLDSPMAASIWKHQSTSSSIPFILSLSSFHCLRREMQNAKSMQNLLENSA